MLECFIDYNLIKNLYNDQKVNILLNAKEFYKGQKEILIAFEENIFPLPKPYVFGKNVLVMKNLCQKLFKLNFLEEHDQTELS